MVAYNEVTGTAQSNIRLEVVIMRYPQTGNEVFVSFSLSNTMFSGIGKGTITREEVSADYLKALFSKYGVIVSAKPEQRRLLERVNALYDLELERRQSEESEARRSQIGTGDRSEKIRTYNFPQGRVTDHRIKLTLHRLDGILNGDLDEIIDALAMREQAEKLRQLDTQSDR